MSDLIEEFGKAIDNILEESDVRMMVRLPEGSMDAEVVSPFTDRLGPVMDFYILLHGLSKVVQDLVEQEPDLNPDREAMVDGILEMVKKDIMDKVKKDGD